MISFLRLSSLVALVSLVAIIAGCDHPPDDVTQSAAHPPEAASDSGPTIRIVSLAPALTQMVVDMRHAQALVGVAQNDAAAPKGLPVVGNYLDLDTEALIKARPTHVLMMVGKEGPPARLTELAKTHKFDVVAFRVPRDVNEIGNIIYNEELEDKSTTNLLPSLAVILEDSLAGRSVKYKMLLQLGSIGTAVDGAPKPRVLLVIGTNPVMACGPGTVLDEVLRMVGGENVAREAKVGAPTLDREKLISLAPEVILLIQPGGPALEAIDKDTRLAEFRGLDVPAVKHHEIHLIDDPLALLPSSSISQVAAEIAKAIHPDLANQIDAAMDLKTIVASTHPSETAESPETSGSTAHSESKPHATTQPSGASRPVR